MKILTISIAAYNMEKYIRQALNSLMDKRIIDELEIFVIDDGGTDRTIEIAKQYAERYPNSIFPIHKENGGWGSTVNYSIKHASGKYFKILDGDDWYDRDGLYQLVKKLQATNSDIVITNSRTGSEERGFIEEYFAFGSGETIKIKDILKYTNITFPVKAITYKTEVLRASGLRLPNYLLYTDQLYNVVPFSVAKTITSVDCFVNYYRTGRDGQSMQKDSMLKHSEEMISVNKKVLKFCAEMKRQNCENCPYIMRVGIQNYKILLMHIFIHPVSKRNLNRIKYLESKISFFLPEIYCNAEKEGRRGLFIYCMRRTHYLSYWLLKIIPIPQFKGVSKEATRRESKLYYLLKMLR